MSVKWAIIFIKGAMTFIGKGGLAIGRLFKAVKAGVVDDIKGVIRRDLRWQLIIYKLKSPSVLINSLISISNHSIGLSSWAMLYSAYSTDLLFLLKTYTLLY